MGTLREQQGGAGVPEVVKTDVRQPGALEEWLEGAVAEIGGVDDAAVLVCEDETTRAIEGTHPLYFFELSIGGLAELLRLSP